MAAKHTPGPWEAVDSMTIRGPFERSNPEKPGFFVALLPSSRAEGDARLIAAAPELLEALLLFVDYEKAMDERNDVSGMIAYAEFEKSARAAIAKATGN